MYTYTEKDVDALIKRLEGAELVVGFNLIRFDYSVLSAYTTANLKALPTFDILLDVTRRLEHRLSLDALAKATIGRGKIANGLESIRWFKEGKIERVIDYCIRDVEITRDLFMHGMEKGYVCYEKKDIGSVRLPVEWEIESLIKRV